MNHEHDGPTANDGTDEQRRRGAPDEPAGVTESIGSTQIPPSDPDDPDAAATGTSEVAEAAQKPDA